MNDKKTTLPAIDIFRNDLVKEEKTLSNYLGGDQHFLKFANATTGLLKNNPDLLTCDRNSLMQALRQVAEYKLYPSTLSGDCYIIKYGSKANFQIGYKGLIKLLYRGNISYLATEIVFENDNFKYVAGTEPKIVHEPDVFSENRGKAIGCYAVCKLNNGETLFKVMSKNDILKFKKFSQSASSSHSPWNEDKDPQLNMWRKTVIKQIVKLLPLDEKIASFIQQDTLNDLKPTLAEKAKDKLDKSKLEMNNFLVDNKENNEPENNQKEFTGEEYAEEWDTEEEDVPFDSAPDL